MRGLMKQGKGIHPTGMLYHVYWQLKLSVFPAACMQRTT